MDTPEKITNRVYSCGGKPLAPFELDELISAYGEQCRRAGAEAMRAIVCEEWQAFATTKGVTAAALVAVILNRFDALPLAAEAST